MKQSAETDAEETTGAAPAGTTAAETVTAAETTAASESTSREAGNTPAYSMTDPAGSETASVPTQTDESFRTGAGKTTLIIGLVIGIAVIYLIVITIGTKNKKKTPRRKNKI